jgi:hypothetical protein
MVVACFVASTLFISVQSRWSVSGCGVGVGRNFRWSRSRKEFLGGVGVGKKCTDSDSDLSLKS